jgi:RND family efflux transporter MFP subunit
MRSSPLVALFFLSSACCSLFAQTEDPAAGLPVTTAVLASASSYEANQRFAGLLEATQRSTLAFTTSAPLAALYVDAGDSVTEGQALARLDARELEATLRSAQAALRLAEAEFQAQAALAALAKVKGERAAELFARGQLAEQSFDEARLAAEAEQARVRVAEARAEQARAQAEEAEVRLSRAELRAPYAGRVAERHVDEGTLVAPGAPVLTLVSSGVLEAHIGLPPTLAPSLARRDAYTLTVEGQSYPGELLQVLPQLDATARTATARFRIRNPGNALRAGQLVELHLPRTLQADGFWVPLTALAEANRGLWSLFLAQEDGAGGHRATRTLVEVLHSTTERAFVRGDLLPGDRLVLTGVGRLVPGQALRLVQP